MAYGGRGARNYDFPRSSVKVLWIAAQEGDRGLSCFSQCPIRLTATRALHMMQPGSRRCKREAARHRWSRIRWRNGNNHKHETLLAKWRIEPSVRADVREGAEDSYFSVFRARRFREWPGPLHWIAFHVEILTKLLMHWIPPLFSLKTLFFHWKVLPHKQVFWNSLQALRTSHVIPWKGLPLPESLWGVEKLTRSSLKGVF